MPWNLQTREENFMKKKRTQIGLSSPEPGAGTVRERALAHMQNLMRTATTVGAGIVLAAGATGQTQRRPQVVDPPPPPSCLGGCENPDELLIRGCLDQYNHWVKSGTQWTLHLSLMARGGPNRVNFAGLKREAIKVSGVSIKDMKVLAGTLDLVLVAGVRNPKATLQFPALCNDKQITLVVVLDLSKAPVENGPVPVKMGK
jgi:hypothetical protein